MSGLFAIMLPSCLVIIPTYNEAENVSEIIDAVLAQGNNFNVLIVDDNSPDGTGQMVENLQKNNSNIHLLKRSGKLGLGTAYIAGFKYGLEKGFDYLCEMDADFSHNPNDLPRLLSANVEQNGDLAIGSRYVKGGGLVDWPMNRKILSMGASLYVRIITGMPVQDPTAGFKCYSAKLLSRFDFNKITRRGYAFQIEMKYTAFLNKAKIIEVPIIFKDREKGQSKMNGSIIMEAISGVIDMRRKAFKGFYNFNN